MPDSNATGGESALSRLALVLLTLLLCPVAVWAKDTSSSCGFAQTIHNKMSFNEVEMVSRNHNIGVYRGGPVTLRSWVEVSEHAFIGLDDKGQLLQIVKLEDRTIGYLLSGDTPIKDFFVRPPTELVAVGQDGQLYQFKWPQWAKSKLPQIIKQAGAIAVAGTCATGLGLMLGAHMMDVSPFSWPMLAGALGLSSALTSIQAFFATTRYEVDNEVTSGLVKLGARVEGYRISDFVRDPDSGEIVDYLLFSGANRYYKLRRLLYDAGGLRDNPKGFDRSCEHALLARGINPKNYDNSL